jgi:hypothetical protein
MTLDAISQSCITVLGGLAIVLVGRRSVAVRRWGFACGLASQPFWYTQMALHDQWGMLPIYTVYTFSWASGLWTHWKMLNAEARP